MELGLLNHFFYKPLPDNGQAPIWPFRFLSAGWVISPQRGRRQRGEAGFSAIFGHLLERQSLERGAGKRQNRQPLHDDGYFVTGPVLQWSPLPPHSIRRPS